MLRITIVRTAVILLFAFLAHAGPAQVQPNLAQVTNTYCMACHNARIKEGGVALHLLNPQEPWAEAETWERVLRQLRARTMPPADNPRPDPTTYERTVAALASALDRGTRPKVPQPLNDLELAARLAQFLWKSEPDKELLQAAQGRLHDPAVLEAQVRRMLRSSKISGLAQGFFDPWLGLNQLATIPADATAFPQFDAELRRALLRETELLIKSQIENDRPAVELWTANYTYMNERLAKHYGIPNISGPEFRRVTQKEQERAGLLGQGSVLTITSVLTRHAAVDEPSTSPAARAKWIRLHFLGVFAPHPIPGIPPLQKGILLSAQLRTLPDPSCTQCHSNFFPMGYAFENFDELGRWRSEANHEEIDTSGSMPDGTEFTGPVELRRVLLERQDAYLNTITESLLEYALTGKAEFPQGNRAPLMPAVRAVLRQAEPRGFTWSSLLTGIAESAVFQSR